MKKIIGYSLLLVILLTTSCAQQPAPGDEYPPSTSIFPTATPIPEDERATIIIGLDMGGGGAGFAATLYAQEVSTGEDFTIFLPAGSHGASNFPTSAPVTLFVRAPATYVFYARLINAPDNYYYGYTTCDENNDCVLKAVEVAPYQTYNITINDRGALLPERGEPVTIPWTK